MAVTATLADPSIEQARRMLADQWCWWCHKGPWLALPMHTVRAHGISAQRLREFADVYADTRTCSLELSAALSLRPSNYRNIRKAQAVNSIRPPGRRTMSAAGKRSNRAKLEAYVAGLGPAEVAELRRRNAAASAAFLAKPHPCSFCGTTIPTARPRTCSPECLREIKRRNLPSRTPK